MCRQIRNRQYKLIEERDMFYDVDQEALTHLKSHMSESEKPRPV